MPNRQTQQTQTEEQIQIAVKPLFGGSSDVFEAAFKYVVKADNKQLKNDNPNRFLMKQKRVAEAIHAAVATATDRQITVKVGAITQKLTLGDFAKGYLELLQNPMLSSQKIAAVKETKNGNVVIRPIPEAFGIVAE